MRDVPESLTAAWRSTTQVGDQRPMARVTVQHPHAKLHRFTLTSTYKRLSLPNSGVSAAGVSSLIDPFHHEKIDQLYVNHLFGGKSAGAQAPRELPGVESVSWQRSLDSDVAECTVVLRNSLPLADGAPPLPRGQLERPGALFPYYGGSSFSSRWGHLINEYFGLLMPDNILRTYEGYGTSGSEIPEEDENLVLTGVWMIDEVTPSALDGTLSIRCRDLGRLLLEHLVYSPVTPKDFYPLTFRDWNQKVTVGGKEVVESKGKLPLTAIDSSNTVWIGSGSVGGHLKSHACDGDLGTFWLSIGNDSPSRRFAYEWVQFACIGTLTSVRFSTKRGGYQAYLSVKIGGVWQGAQTINYHEDGIGHNGANIPFTHTMGVPDEGIHEFAFTELAGVTDIRLTLGNLQWFPNGPYHYRAGVREVEAYGVSRTVKDTTHDVALTPGPAGANPGRCQDYTDIIALCLAWTGFLWPADGKVVRTVTEDYPLGVEVSCEPTFLLEKVLGHGTRAALWADLETTGTTPCTPIKASEFDKRPVMDVITYVRNIIGHVFFIDESGAAQWRLPNLYRLGNVKSGLSATPGRTSAMVTLDESANLLDLSATLGSEAVREGIFVADTAGRFGVIRPGWNPNPTGLRRFGGWTDQHFASRAECRMMADLIALRSLFQYRVDKIRIKAYPAIQMDDQVRVYERTTSEGYVHYVRGISSENNLVDGTWTYDLQTNWLGTDPNSRWVFNPHQLGEEAQAHVASALALQGGETESRLESI